METKVDNGWKFTNEHGDFILKDANRNSYLYFPLCSENGLMSSITPDLGGDIKSGQHTFLLEPVSSEALHNSKGKRNFWIYIDGYGAWSAAGNSARQAADIFSKDEEEVEVEAGFLWHRIIRTNNKLGIKAEITNFIPQSEDKVEIMKIKITNTGERNLLFTPTAAIPVFGRSADNLRDHRHVTSLLNRITSIKTGLIIKPTLSFDERGHKINNISYYVLGVEEGCCEPFGFFHDVEEFIGEGGNLEWPEAIVKNYEPNFYNGSHAEGYEAMGAIRFDNVILSSGASKSFIIMMGINDNFNSDFEIDLVKKYGIKENYEYEFNRNIEYWRDKINKIGFKTSDNIFDSWMKWVTLQPVLRRIYGCSFLPQHDYGRGGRGWRDLWQDCLALLIMDPGEVRNMLLDNFGGIRVDGSNATIIGSMPGEFKADRNNIVRVWMDHGAWPFLTAKLYIDLSGDIGFLLENQVYFKDKFHSRCTKIDENYKNDYGNNQRNDKGKIYEGTILEHLLIQNMVPFFNVGKHNNIRLEGGDWNDGLDMARESGESVAFTALYGSNLVELAELLRKLKEFKGISEIEVNMELLQLMDSLSEKIDYSSVDEKNMLLNKYFDLCKHNVTGIKAKINIDRLSEDLERKADFITEHIKQNELIKDQYGFAWFNGYYDNNGERLEGTVNNLSRMILTGQVFTIMGNIADDEQVFNIIKACNKYLKDEKVGGFRLNTNFSEVKLDMGRLFGFAYGHKENGAMFSHMAVMYANALYKRGFAKDGYEVIKLIYEHCRNFQISRIYPGIPEYINEKGRGMYNYLTGSASWLLLTMLCEVFGVKGVYGKLVFEPKLVLEQFSHNGTAGVNTIFSNKKIIVTYKNEDKLDYGEYIINSIEIDNRPVNFVKNKNMAAIDRQIIDSLDINYEHTITVTLSRLSREC